MISASFMLTLHCSFSSLILSSISMISFYIFFKRLRLKYKGISEAGVVTLTEKEHGFAEHSYKNS